MMQNPPFPHHYPIEGKKKTFEDWLYRVFSTQVVPGYPHESDPHTDIGQLSATGGTTPKSAMIDGNSATPV